MDYFLADDLSGALDAAAAFHRAGRRVRILVDPVAWDEAELGDVVAVSTETRNADALTASGAIHRVLEAARRRGARLSYKKIDSTLRGQVGAELRAVAEAYEGYAILFTPANLAVGRTVEHGQLLVRGVPVAETEFARDPVSPLRTSDVRQILGEVAQLPQVHVPDVRTEQDFVAAIARIDATGKPWIGVGSAGLAHFVAGRSTTGGRPSEPVLADGQRGGAVAADEAAAAPAATRAILMLGGSAHPLNRRQIAALCGANHTTIAAVDATSVDLAVATGTAALRAGRTAVLQLPEVRLDPERARALITTAAERIVASTGVDRIFATGGETAFALCSRLGVRSLVYQEELEPGMALARGKRADGGELLLAVKPGGFGDELTWVRARDRLARH